MLFRTTAQTSANHAIRYVSRYNANIVNYQKQISSGVRIHRSSDDPVAFRQVTSLTSQLYKLRSESTAITDTEAKLNASVSNIQRANDLIVKAKSLAQQGIQATTESERNALAVEAEGLLNNLQDISRARSAGSYLFAGARSNDPPYEFDGPLVAGGTMVADYQGYPENSFAFIGTSISIETFYAGDTIFDRSDRGDLLIYGSTGAQNGAGTDSMVGRADLIVEHTTTTYAGASGIAPGISSPDEDNILGQLNDNHVQIVDTSGTGDFGTIILNEGDSVDWTRTDTDLQITSEDGRSLFVDMSNITAGFSGSVTFTSDGTLSIDGGATTIPIDFSASQMVIDSTTGEQAHFDTTQMKRTGTDHVEFPGTSNVFQVFYELIEDLRNTRNLTAVENAEALDRRFGELDSLGDHMLQVMGRQSASLQSLEELKYRVEDLELETETQINEFSATDIPETVLRMQNEQSLLQFTYSVTAAVTSSSILDFLR